MITPELVSDRHPDLALVFFGTPLDELGFQRPALVCEVVSRGARARRRDYQDKSEEYRKIGIREYWIIDPGRKHVAVQTLKDDLQAPHWSQRIFTGDEVIVSELLPGFQGTVSQLWIDTEPDEDESAGNGS